MISITNWNELIALENKLGESILSELKRYFIELVTEIMDESDYLNYSLDEIGKIAVLEETDDINNLPAIFLTEDSSTLLDSLPEFVDEIELDDGTWHRCIIILGDCYGVVLYVPELPNKDRLMNWIKEWKGGENQ